MEKEKEEPERKVDYMKLSKKSPLEKNHTKKVAQKFGSILQ